MVNTVCKGLRHSDIPMAIPAEDGPYSAECLREQLLIPNLAKATKTEPLVVSIDGLDGYASSFS